MENNLIIGIVYNPIINQLFTAQKGQGAYLNNEKISVSNTEGNSKNKIKEYRLFQFRKIKTVII